MTNQLTQDQAERYAKACKIPKFWLNPQHIDSEKFLDPGFWFWPLWKELERLAKYAVIIRVMDIYVAFLSRDDLVRDRVLADGATRIDALCAAIEALKGGE